MQHIDDITPQTQNRSDVANKSVKRIYRYNKLLSDKLGFYRRAFYSLLTIVLVVMSGFFVAYLVRYHDLHSVPDPIPISVRDKVKFPLYFPNPSRLPASYKLNTASFTDSAQAVVYSLTYRNQTMVFSVQNNPGVSAINNFYSSSLALHTTMSTPVGNATIGAIGSQSIVSLPTSRSWILITGPSNFSQQQYAPVLSAMTEAY